MSGHHAKNDNPSKFKQVTDAAGREAEKMRVRSRRYEQRLHKLRRRVIKKNPFFGSAAEAQNSTEEKA
ncbi:MAG: hypothetical protein WAS05_06630 [Candidatus Nanopelagicales bacterium]